MRAQCREFSRLRFFAWVCAVALGACQRGTDAEGSGQLATAPTHLDMYLADTSMPLDRSVLAELANDTLQLAGARGALITARLASDSFAIGSAYAKSAFAVLRDADPAPPSGDGQALIVDNAGTLDYGPHVELAVPDNLYELDDVDFPVGRLRWVTSIVNLDNEPYTPLRIEAKESLCLFVGRDLNWNVFAYVLNPGSTDCSALPLMTILELVQKGAKELKGFPLDPKSVDGDFDKHNLPGVARWEWSKRKEQTIGVRCASRWCQVAPIGTAVSDLEDTPSPDGSSDTEEKAKYRLKGWFDRQELAKKNNDGTLSPSGVNGRIVPAKKGSMQLKKKMKVVARIILESPNGAPVPSKYTAMHLEIGINTLEMCKGLYSLDCEGTGSVPPACATSSPDIWGRITSASGTKGPVFRVCFFDDGTYGTAEWTTRFAWDPNDEGLWVRCLNGCCQPKF